MTAPSSSAHSGGFFDFFRRLLGWNSCPPYVIPLNKRLRLPPEGQTHSPTAVKAQVKE